MNTANLKTALVSLTILVVILFSTALFAECDMMAMIAKRGNCISWIDGTESPSYFLPDDPHDYFKFLYELSDDNPDGYGIVYIDSDGNIPAISYPTTISGVTNHIDSNGQAWFVITDNLNSNNVTIENYPNPYNDAKSEILESNNEVGIVLGHVRDASGSIGNHPFQIICDTDGDEVDETYMFIHNGNVTDMVSTFRSVIISIDSNWFTDNPSNWFGSSSSTSGWIDSEMYFHYIMAHITEAEGNIMKGIYNALSNLTNCTSLNKSLNEGFLDQDVNANFVLTDGENLYAYRNCGDDDHLLVYHKHNDGFWGIQTSNEQSYFTDVDQNACVIFTPYGDPIVMNNFLIEDQWHVGTTPNDESYRVVYKYNFISGEIDNNTADLNLHYYKTYISGDTYIESGHTLDFDPVTVITTTVYPNVRFAGHHSLFIEGTLNINENSTLNLSNCSQVEVSDTGLLFLDWGSTITGKTAGWYEETPPGQSPGGEAYIPGDRIIAQNGGKVTTRTKTQYLTNPGDPIIISSNSDELWDGIYIQTPDHEDTYWFVNCDISGISNLSIANVSESQNIAHLNLYSTDFTDAGQIVARHGHNLNIEGSSAFVPCNISNNHLTPIVAYDSPVFIQYALIEENGRDIYGGLLNSSCDGIYLNYSSGDLSEIKNSIIQDNTGCGIEAYYEDVNIDNNTVQTNEQHGVFTKTGTFEYLQNNTILNNDYAEYAGQQSSYIWANEDNEIADEVNAGGNDQYILISYTWDEHEESIDVRGNTINHENNEERFYPEYEAFHFSASSRALNPEYEMLQNALYEMRNENYFVAEMIFQEIISTYPDSTESATSIRGLLFIENYTDLDYAALRNYIDTIEVDESLPLYTAKEDVKTKSFMKEKEYEIAIDRLENVINTSQILDDVILAMIDQGYCYMELAEGGERTLPTNCTVKTATFRTYQAKVKELESQFSFLTDENNENLTQKVGNILSLTNYPNPFNPITTISFDLNNETEVSVTVYNMKGQKVKQLVKDQFSAGQHSIEWNSTDSNNKSVSSGIYFYKISTSEDEEMKKMLLLK